MEEWKNGRMRVVTYKELVGSPIGTVFSVYSEENRPGKCMFYPTRQLLVLTDVYGSSSGLLSSIDFSYTILAGVVWDEILFDAEPCIDDRWGLYEYDNLFIVYEKEDVKKIILELQSAFNKAY